MSMTEKVVKLENESMKIYECIQGWFRELERNNRDYLEVKQKFNSSTSKTYETEVRMFFYLIRGKNEGREIEELNMEDIRITQKDFEEYINVLCELKNEDGTNKYVNKTINKKIAALKSLVRFIKRKNILKNYDISFIDLIKGQKERANHYGVLETNEVLEMAEWCKTEGRKPLIKNLLVLTAFKTGLRLSELLNLKWIDFIEKENGYLIDGVGKGNKEFDILIAKDFYNDLLTIKNNNEYVFEISARAVQDMVDRYKKKNNIDPNRNIVFHSIRKAFGTLIYNTTGDINEARKALRHSSIVTTQIYLGIQNYNLHNSIFMIDKIDDKLFTKVTLEQLVEAISNTPKSNQLIINLKLQEFLKQNN